MSLSAFFVAEEDVDKLCDLNDKYKNMPKFMFSGIARIKVIEAENLKATDYSTRIFQNSGFLLSPYVNIDIDDLPLGRTVTKHRNQNPAFNEEFKADIHLGKMLNCTVFHDSALPPDEFVANCSLPLHSISDELKAMSSDLAPPTAIGHPASSTAKAITLIICAE